MVESPTLSFEGKAKFHKFKDSLTDFYLLLKKDDMWNMTNWVICNITDDNKIRRFRIAHFRIRDRKEKRL
jgi:hypothetical protein